MEKENQKEFKAENLGQDYKKEDEMGRGYFGLPKKTNYWVRFFIILIFFIGLSFFLFKINQLWAGIISLGVGLMFLLFNNLLRD